MTKNELKIPEIVWRVLHDARLRLMTSAGYPEFAAKEFADTELEFRKKAAEELGPEGGLLADIVWIRGPGRQIQWTLEVVIPPIPKDIRSVIGS